MIGRVLFFWLLSFCLAQADYPRHSSSVTYSYNLLGQLTNAIDGSGSTLAYGYDNQGLAVAISNAYGQIKAISYDILDRPTNVVDINGVSVGLTYDSLNRLLTRSYPDGGIERFGYSPAGLIAYTNQDGNAIHYAYDAEGRKTAETNAISAVTQYGYDGASDLISLTDGNSHTTSWGYDIYGRQIAKTNANGALIVAYSYDANGRLTNRWMTGTNTGYNYDAVGNLKTTVYPQLTITNSYDPINELTNMVDAVNGSVPNGP